MADDDIGVAEAKLQETGHPLVGVGNLLADEVFARYAEMNAPRLEMPRDLAGRQKLDRGLRHAIHSAAIAALVAGLLDGEAGGSEDFERVFHEAAF